MNVIIDGVEYVPKSETLANADETAKSIIRAFVSGFYNEPSCNINGGPPRRGCDCTMCLLYFRTIQYLGGVPNCVEEPLLEPL